MFKKILIANRGEIACRIIKTCQRLGIPTVAVYLSIEGNPLHARMADESLLLPQKEIPATSYLDAPAIIELARRCGADAIHPGYGFLSESPAFAELCEEAGITFIGPKREIAELMADKWAAREKLSSLSIPVLPGHLIEENVLELKASEVESVGFPMIVKASGGGGGIGMQEVFEPSQLSRAVRRASSSASRAFGTKEVYVEKLITSARHIEVQIVADQQGNVFHLWERECSGQRRHQKIVEESPSPSIDDSLRDRLLSMSVKAAKSTNYVGVGTFEYIVDVDNKPYFLEANTRLQVEHGVTEMVTGVDIVEQQIRAASGLKVTLSGRNTPVFQGHSIECRVYAEDAKTFVPSPGNIDEFKLPTESDLRIDTGYMKGDKVTPYFDPLLAKVICWGENRQDAIRRMERVITEIVISPVETNLSILKKILNDPEFLSGYYTTDLVKNLARS